MKSSLTIKKLITLTALLILLIPIGASAVDLDTGYEVAKLSRDVSGTCPSSKDESPDRWAFAACNCTSYVAYRLNLNGVNGFSNSYGGVQWHSAENWDNAARSIGIRVDQYAAEGSVAQWNANDPGAGTLGHVAYVYKTNVRSGVLQSIEIAEYNARNDGTYQIRVLTPGDDKYPKNFIHLEEKVSGEKPNAICITSEARNLPGSRTGPFCWIHGESSYACEYGTFWYYSDTVEKKDYSLSASSCPLPGSNGGGGYVTTLNDSALQSGINGIESFNPLPSGDKHSGDLPDLIIGDFYLLQSNKNGTPLTQIHVNQTSYCGIQVKNVGEAGAWGTFANRCYLSKGNWRDHDPDNLGHESITDLRAGQSRRVYQVIPPFKYPGRFNITAKADTDGNDSDKKITELDEGNNSHDEYVFDVVSSPNLVVSSLTASTLTPQPHEAFSVTATTTNRGENFGQDKQSTAVYIDGVLLSNHWRTRETLQGGMSETEIVTIPGIDTEGVHTIMSCGDFNGLVPETNESDNCQSITVTVQPTAPVPSPTDPGTRVVNTPEPPVFSSLCGTEPQEADLSVMPALSDGMVGAVIQGNHRQRMFIPQANVPWAAGWNEQLQSWMNFDPSQVTRVCWNSNETGWGVTQASCGNGFVLNGSTWIADIPSTPLASKGVWTIQQNGQTYWLSSPMWTAIPEDVDGHIRYGNWDENRLTLTKDMAGYAVLTASFGIRGIPGYWFPEGAVMNGHALWYATDTSATMPGTVTCDPITGTLTAKIVGVNPGSTGRVVLGLSTPSGQYAWPSADQWVLPTDVVRTGDTYTIPDTFMARHGNPRVIYNKVSHRLSLLIRSDDLMRQAFYNVPTVGTLTDAVWFNAWIAPPGGQSQMIKGTLTRSDTGFWTIVFDNFPSGGYGGSVYIINTDGTQSWQNIGSFDFTWGPISFGITVHLDPSKGEGWYIMP